MNISRLAYNSAGWSRPSGEARALEAPETYNAINGFGHEEWLFRSEWMIDGWRYSFIQGVNKSRDKLVREARPIDLTLYTIEPDKRRRFVSIIDAVECLDDRQAREAVAEFKRRGWFQTMRDDIKRVDGNLDAFGSGDYAPHILNVRFRLANVQMFPPDSYVSADHPIHPLSRYQLYSISETFSAEVMTLLRAGFPDLPEARSFVRAGSAPVECTPEHSRMQARLMELLQAEFPEAVILREQDFVDVSVRTPGKLILFEIKSDLDPRTVIRQALGQILEYAYHPARNHQLPVELVIVGRNPLSPADEEYLALLRRWFSLPLSYRVVSI